MNTIPKNPRFTPLTKNPSRWAWMAGAAAAATNPGAHAGNAQITLANNYFDYSTYHLSLSVTSGHPFGTASHAFVSDSGPVVRGNLGNSHKGFSFAANQSGTNDIFLEANNHIYADKYGTGPHKAFALIPLQITDPNVAGGQANTNALLEVEAINQGVSDESISLLSVFYSTSGNTTPNLTINSSTGAITGSYTNVGSSDDGVFTPVPEPSSWTPLLLTLGAGGVLARRAAKRRGKAPGE